MAKPQLNEVPKPVEVKPAGSVYLKQKIFSSPGFAPTMRKLSMAPAPIELANRFRKINDEIASFLENSTKVFQAEIVEKFAKKDEKGEIVWLNGEKTNYDIADGKLEEFQKAMADWDVKEIKIERKPLKLHELGRFYFAPDKQLSAAELRLLEGIFVDE